MKIPKNIYTYFTNPWYHGYTYKEKNEATYFSIIQLSENIETTIFWSKSLSNSSKIFLL